MNRQLQKKRLRIAESRPAPMIADTDDSLSIAEVRGFRPRDPESGRSYAVLEVRTRSGVRGYGECRALSDTDLKSAAAVLTGRPASAYEVLGATVPASAQAAVNMAALDILGKASKAPVYRVLGGPTRNKARAITSLEGSSDDQLQADLQKQHEAGFRAFLVPIPAAGARNQGSAFVKAAEARLKGLRTSAPDCDFALAGADRLTPGDAATLAAVLEPMFPLWFDEPCAVSNLNTVRKIAAESVMPLGFGREVADAGTYQDLLRNGLVDVLRPDLLTHGITGIRRLAAMAETYYVAVAPQHEGGSISTAAALHLAASIPNFFILQLPRPLAGARLKDGFLELPKAPGLGVDVNEAELERNRIA